MLHIANPFYFTVNFFRGRHSAARRIHMNDDGFDGIVVSKPAHVLDNFTGINDHAIKIYDSNLVTESVNAGLTSAGMQRDVDQSEYGQHEEEESASSD